MLGTADDLDLVFQVEETNAPDDLDMLTQYEEPVLQSDYVEADLVTSCRIPVGNEISSSVALCSSSLSRIFLAISRDYDLTEHCQL